MTAPAALPWAAHVSVFILTAEGGGDNGGRRATLVAAVGACLPSLRRARRRQPRRILEFYETKDGIAEGLSSARSADLGDTKPGV